MNLVRVGAAALNQTPLDWSGNKKNILDSIESGKKAGVQILCLPELAISGYGCEDCFHSLWISERSSEVLLEVLEATKDITVAIGLPLTFQGSMYNCVAILSDKQILGIVAKQNLASDGLHYESRWFKPWTEGQLSKYQINDLEVPFGDCIFEVGGVRLGFEICEDAWVANRTALQKSHLNLDLILNPSASHFAFGKSVIRERLVLEGSRALNVGYIYANMLGNESGRIIFDGEVLIAANGDMLASGPRFSFEDVVLTYVDLDIQKIRQRKIQSSQLQNKPIEDGQYCVESPFDFRTSQVGECDHKKGQWETSSYAKEEEFTRAVSLGLFDYMRKSHSKGFIVSLSGGADSAAVVSLIYTMMKLGVSELGMDAFVERGGLSGVVDENELMQQLLTCAYQSTEHSSRTTYNAAHDLAKGIGAEFHHFDVSKIVEAYEGLATQAMDRDLSWEKDDIPLQNIQARVRAPSVWFLANLKNALLLSTSNRSEAAVGYATMDGDTCGGLCPVAGIDKAFLRHWLRWIEKQDLDQTITIPSLDKVNAQIPTAELRPESENQTDEDDLMPYEILDFIEKAAIRDKKSPADCLFSLKREFNQIEIDKLKSFVVKFFRLWSRNQWKRERYAPSFHLDDENLDPKTWCRFPILSGGFENELSEIQ